MTVVGGDVVPLKVSRLFQHKLWSYRFDWRWAVKLTSISKFEESFTFIKPQSFRNLYCFQTFSCQRSGKNCCLLDIPWPFVAQYQIIVKIYLLVSLMKSRHKPKTDFFETFETLKLIFNLISIHWDTFVNLMKMSKLELSNWSFHPTICHLSSIHPFLTSNTTSGAFFNQ